MAFVGSANNLVTNANTVPVALVALKTALVAAGWTIQGSGNGVATFSNNAVPGPAAADNTGDFVNNNSWVRLREPSPGTREYVFLRGTATTLLAKYSRSSGFGTGGSATACPTTGATGDGCVIYGTSLGFSATGSGTNASPYDMGSTNNTSATSFQSAAGNSRLSVIASNTATNGVWGWWMMAWSEGSGAHNFACYTDAVDAVTCPSNDYDPSYRQLAGTNWWANDIAALGRVNYWQGYPASWTSPATTANYRFDGVGGSYWVAYNSSWTPIANTWPLGTPAAPVVSALNPYNDKNLLIPFWIATGAVTGVPPKGMTTNVGLASGVFNLTDTLDLTSANPRIIVSTFASSPWYLALPWLQNVLPVV